MSDEDTTLQANPSTTEPVEETPKTENQTSKPASSRRNTRKKESDYSENEDTEAVADNPNESKQEASNEKPASEDEVSFSFDPNEVKEPEGDAALERASGLKGNREQENRQGGDRKGNQKKNFRKDGHHHKHRKDFKKHGRRPQPTKQAKKHTQKQARKRKAVDSLKLPEMGSLLEDKSIGKLEDLKFLSKEASGGGDPIKLNDYYQMPLQEFVEVVAGLGVKLNVASNRHMLLDILIKHAAETKRQILDTGLLWVTEDDGAFIVHEHNNYVPHPQDFFLPDCFVKKYGLKSGHMVDVQVLPQEGAGCGYVVDFFVASGLQPEEIQHLTPFEDLIPYYPTERILLETPVEDLKNQDVSMRIVDALTPIGFGQRGLIVAPPRTGKTVILQGLANSLAANNPDADLIVLLIDERPEEVTDFRRVVKGEVIASTFDEAADNHVHVAEMVIEKARRMVEVGRNVIILLDSITRLARGYNTMMPNSGKILSGGVEAGALQKPKRFFGSARNIEGGGSLTVMGTALVETGSKMDEVVFEEFKGTGNMELHLDRALSDKRIFPAINLEKSGTRKEELLYHKDELSRIYSLRRAMKGVPSTEAMEMLITRIKKTATNVEFLMQVNR